MAKSKVLFQKYDTEKEGFYGYFFRLALFKAAWPDPYVSGLRSPSQSGLWNRV